MSPVLGIRLEELHEKSNMVIANVSVRGERIFYLMIKYNRQMGYCKTKDTLQTAGYFFNFE